MTAPAAVPPGEEDPSASPGHRRSRNLFVGATLLLCAWSGVAFVPPYRWIADAERMLFGDFWDPSVIVLLGIAWLVVALRAVKYLPDRLFPPAPRWIGDAILLPLLAIVMVGFPVKAWQTWQRAAGLSGPDDPVQVVDLDRLGAAAPPTGHVQLVGTPDVGRRVLVRSFYKSRRDLWWRTVWTAYVPVVPRHGGGAAPVRFVALGTGDYRDEEPDPSGNLVADGLSARERYRLRQGGMSLAEHPYKLSPWGTDPRGDAYSIAVILLLVAVSFWIGAGVTARNAWQARQRRGGPGATLQ